MNNEKRPTAEIYARMGLSQIPRILTLQDRNPLSKTYGSFSRTWWLDRTTDFSNALSQYATHALVLAWANEMPNNRYYQQPKILDWIFAGMEHWVSCQNSDGSFDEFYPGERGWAGPTGFLVYAMADSYLRIKDDLPADLTARLLKAIRKGGRFLGRHDEIGDLANHYVMALLAVRYALEATSDRVLERQYNSLLDKTLSWFDDEGWGREYDGADIGYLSASVSFFAKLAQIDSDKRIDEVMEKAVTFSSYFVYPDGHYAGTLGSRNTLHFYPHGYELLASTNPLAARIADAMVEGLASGALVPPEIMADRYFLYRVPEFLLSYIDHADREKSDARLPYEGDDFSAWFPKGRFYVSKKENAYCVINGAKGGVVKCFDIAARKLVYADTGIMIQTRNNLLSSQWIDPEYQVEETEDGISIKGRLHQVPAKVFTPLKTVIFRLFLICFGWNTWLAYQLKGGIRRLLMLKHQTDPTRFTRSVSFDCKTLTVTDELRPEQQSGFLRVLFADDVPVRYVPQSRYFQPQELLAKGWWASQEQLRALSAGFLRHERSVDLTTGEIEVRAWNAKERLFD